MNISHLRRHPRPAYPVICFALALALPLMMPSTRAGAVSPGSEGGVFSLYSRNAPLNDTEELRSPNVAGLSVKFGWSDLEKTPGEYDWRLLEKAHRITEQLGKQLIIRVNAGCMSPGWLYARGIPRISFQGGETNWMPAGESGTMPVPWGEGYLLAWEHFIAALGQEISGWQNVYCVEMTGGGFIDEMHLPRTNPETVRQWNEAGISDEKIVAMWKKIIAAYDRAIPAKAGLAIGLGIPFAQSRAPEAVYQYALEHYPGRVWFQQNGLKAERIPNAPFPAMIRAASVRTTVGYQMLGGGKFLDAQTGDRRTAFEHAIQDHSSYVEVYKADLVDPTWEKAVAFLADGLREELKTRGRAATAVHPPAGGVP